MSGEQRVAQYLAEANPHSQGKFNWDPVRMAELLALYPGLDPEEFVLHCLAAAVAGGASQFHLHKRGTSTVLRWNGQPLSSEDLDNLGPQGDARRASLALAVNAAARLGRVQLSGAGGTLDIEPGQPCRRLARSQSESRLELVRTRWWYALTPSPSPALLRARAAYAPLETNISLPIKVTKVPWAVRWGRLPRLPCQPRQWIEKGVTSWGVGCAFPGQGRWTVVIGGISYSHPALWPRLDVIWWSSVFPLDLTRSQLVQGEQLARWQAWVKQTDWPLTALGAWPDAP